MYKIVVKKSAVKELAQISPPYNKKIVETIDNLANNPRPEGIKKLKGEEAYRIRVADYRIIYIVEDVIEVVEIQRIRHRKDAYKSPVLDRLSCLPVSSVMTYGWFKCSSIFLKPQLSVVFRSAMWLSVLCDFGGK